MDMPMKKRRSVAAQAAARGPLPVLPDALMDELVKGPMTPSQVQDLMLAFNKAIVERAMGAEMNMHLGYRPGEAKPADQDNARNGVSGKTVITNHGSIRVDLPRDRDGSFAPILIPKHERRFTGFDERIIAMYARGMSIRDIQEFIAESYGTEVSPDFISSVTDEVMAETIAWQVGRWRPCIRWCFSMRCGSRSAATAWLATRPFTWRWASRPMASATC